MMSEPIRAADLSSLVGQEQEPSSWLEITQARVNEFAEATNDHQFIHVDPEKASKTPFGGPIAHGYLTLSLLPFLMAEKSMKIDGLVMGINYGSDIVRFLQPVRIGSRIRARQKIMHVNEKNPGQWLVKTQVSGEREHQEKPALIAECLSMMIIK